MVIGENGLPAEMDVVVELRHQRRSIGPVAIPGPEMLSDYLDASAMEARGF